MSTYDDSVELLAALVGLPTESRTPNIALVDLVEERARGAGAAVHRVDGPTGRANLHLRFGPEAPGGVLVCGHTDVVAAGPGWATDPYTLTPCGDRLLGRGTADMKGFIACTLATAIRCDPSGWTAPLHVGLSYDEEVGCAGVGPLLERLAGDPLVAPAIVVVGEPTGLTLRTSHAGKVAYTVRASCVAGHSSLSPARTDALAEIVAVARAVIEANISAARLGASTNVGTLHAGSAVNVLAATAELSFECRYRRPGDPEQILAGVWAQAEASRAALAGLEGAVEVVRDARYPPLLTVENDPEVQFLAEVIGRGDSGHLPFGCEAGLYAEYLSVPAVVFGPGHIADAHRPDEFVTTDQLAGACDALAAIVGAYCTPAGTLQRNHRTPRAPARAHESPTSPSRDPRGPQHVDRIH